MTIQVNVLDIGYMLKDGSLYELATEALVEMLTSALEDWGADDLDTQAVAYALMERGELPAEHLNTWAWLMGLPWGE